MASDDTYYGTYGSWYSPAILNSLHLLVMIPGFLAVFNFLTSGMSKLVAIAGAIALVMLTIDLLVQRSNKALTIGERGLQIIINQTVVRKLPWDGKGTALDMGCGSGSLTTCCALHYGKAKVVGVDAWKNPNEVSQQLCDYNAKAEEVDKRVTFQQESLAKLSFEDEKFDAVISNMGLHKASGDKREMIKEAIRVLKPGGAFCLEDNFRSKRLFGNMEQFCEQLLADGVVSEIHYAPKNDKLDFIPFYLRFPWSLGRMGMIWGKK